MLNRLIWVFPNMTEDLLDVAVDFIADTTGHILASIGVGSENQNNTMNE